MNIYKLTAADFDTDGNYTGDVDVADCDGHIEIVAGLGWCRFPAMRAAGSIIAGSGSGITAGEGITAGSGIKAGNGIDAGWGITAGNGIDAGWGITAGLGITAGWGIKAGNGITAGWGITAGEGITAGSGIKAGTGIDAGSGITAGWGIKAGWGIDAGLGIEAGEGITAGWGITAGEGITAGWGITAGSGYGIFAGCSPHRCLADRLDGIVCTELVGGEVVTGTLTLIEPPTPVVEIDGIRYRLTDELGAAIAASEAVPS